MKIYKIPITERVCQISSYPTREHVIQYQFPDCKRSYFLKYSPSDHVVTNRLVGLENINEKYVFPKSKVEEILKSYLTFTKDNYCIFPANDIVDAIEEFKKWKGANLSKIPEENAMWINNKRSIKEYKWCDKMTYVNDKFRCMEDEDGFCGCVLCGYDPPEDICPIWNAEFREYEIYGYRVKSQRN